MVINKALVVVAALLACSAGGRGVAAKAKAIRVYGGRFRHPLADKEFLRTFVDVPKDHDETTPPISVGVELTVGFNNKAKQLPNQTTMMIPLGPTQTFNLTSYTQDTLEFPKVGANPFQFIYWSFNSNGHPPPGIYDIPHWDFHFMLPTSQTWWTEVYPPSAHGPCNGANNATYYSAFKPVKKPCYPAGYSNIGNFEWGMGSHQIDVTGPEWVTPGSFEHALIYGQQEGEIVYFEPMTTQAYLAKLRGKKCVDISKSVPAAFETARYAPFEMCMSKSAKGMIYVQFNKFKLVRGGCSTLVGAQYVGYYPAGSPMAAPIPQGCSAPPIPSAGH